MKNNNKKGGEENLQNLIAQIDDLYSSLKGISKNKFLKDIDLQKNVVQDIQKIGRIGNDLRFKGKGNYTFFWQMFYFMEIWEEDMDTTWDLLKGYTFKETCYESLADHNEDLKLILEAVLLDKPDLSPKERIQVVIQRRLVKDQQNAQDKNIGHGAKIKRGGVKIIYTPMGNKR